MLHPSLIKKNVEIMVVQGLYKFAQGVLESSGCFSNQSIFYRTNHARSYDQIVQVMAKVIFNKTEELSSAFSNYFALLFKIQGGQLPFF